MGNYRFFFTDGTNNEALDDILGAAYWFTPRIALFHVSLRRDATGSVWPAGLC